MEHLSNNLIKIKDRIAEAALRVNRNPDEVTVVAVSKTRALDEIIAARELGIRDFGENRVQELQEKAERLAEMDIDWHMIGHLQRNKVKYLARIADINLIHSLDSLRLARQMEKRGRMAGQNFNVLIQVNTAGDEDKFGLSPVELFSFIRRCREFPHLQIRGLMTIAPFVEDPEEVRPAFARLRNLKEQIAELDLPGVKMEHLSMGMTNDFPIAIEEGATIVRIGTGLFGPRR
ncbi:MAG: YggS family pyridoxal phosphate-dependent enzyme [Halanaerobium sp.]|nr:YggS family pyridoxal phosphate-dependent enzyme [Halanaerobium sp.]